MDGNLGVGIAKPSLSVFVSLGVSGRGDMLNVLASESCLVSSVGVNAPERSFCQSLEGVSESSINLRRLGSGEGIY